MPLRLFLFVTLAILSACTPPGAALRVTSGADAHPIQAKTALGLVRGIGSSEGQAFLGIPFAQPPQGALRWREPLPMAPWPGVRDATRTGNACTQNLNPVGSNGQFSLTLPMGHEDCLNLNIYAPKDAAPGQKRPVMVWLYGGALVLGYNRQYDPSLLAQRTGNLVVAPNYRLGSLGLFSHPALRAEAGGAANLSLLDQQAALRWVRQNIQGFGGDPSNVTLFGESAGGWSVCAQLAAPGARGLFQRAIIQSGPCNLAAATVPLAQADAGGKKIAKELGCAEQDTATCLRQLPVRRVLAQTAPTAGISGQHAWTFVAGDSVLPQAPAQVFAAGRQMPVPLLIGSNLDEGNLFRFMLGGLNRSGNQKGYNAQMRNIFGKRAEAVKAIYSAARFDTYKNAFAKAVTDGIFACPTQFLSQTLRQQMPVWTYEFADRDAPYVVPWTPLGAYHSSEIAYVFDTPWALADPKHFTVSQRQLSQRMQADWGHFARSGSLPWAQTQWHRYAPQDDPSSASYDATHHCDFWREVGI